MKKEIWQAIDKCLQDSPIRVFTGLVHQDLRRYVREGLDFLYVDNSYFDRGPRSGNFRLIRGALHLTHVLPEQQRIVSVPKAEPWREGKRIVVIPPSHYHIAIWDVGDWLTTTLDRLSKATSRQVVVKYAKQEPLRDWLKEAHALVSFSSVAAVEAAMWGVPVFSTPFCPSWPVCSGELEQIDSPILPEREAWLRSLAYADWNIADIDRIELKDYRYQCAS